MFSELKGLEKALSSFNLEEFGQSAPLLPALPRPIVESQEPQALMVRWSQVSLAAGYLVELRPVISGVPGGSETL